MAKKSRVAYLNPPERGYETRLAINWARKSGRLVGFRPEDPRVHIG